MSDPSAAPRPKKSAADTAGAETAATADAASGPVPWSPPRLLAIVASLVVAIGASAALSMAHLGGTTPGCGPGSPCARAAASIWGSVPILGWPTAFVGLAWFFGFLVATAIRRRPFTGALRLAAVAGAVGSVVLVAAMIVESSLCPWCMLVHAANLVAVGLVCIGGGAGGAGGGASARRGGGAGRRTDARASSPSPAHPALAAWAIGFALVSAAAGVSWRAANMRTATSEAQARDESTQAIIDASAEDGAAAEGIAADDGATAGGTGGTDDSDLASATPAGPDAATAGDAAGSAGDGASASTEGSVFTGRYLRGPARAPIRIVAFSDFQCPECREVEARIAAIVAERDDVSFSAKHFPFCVDCNRLARDANFNPHPNACWAARLAEAAGIIDGPDGFWRMYDALFERRGSFTQAELPPLARELGFDPETITLVMTGPDTLERVEADVAEGVAVGLARTPMIFVNGVELRGWSRPGAIRQTVEELAAANLPVLSAAEAGDRPPIAVDRWIDGWAEGRVLASAVLERPGRNALVPVRAGAASAEAPPVDIVVWGDLSLPIARETDARLRTIAEGDARVRYTFRAFPLDPECNRHAPRDLGRGGCLGATIVLAAAAVAGPEGARTAHDVVAGWNGRIADATVTRVASQLGIPEADLRTRMTSRLVASTLRTDIEAGWQAGARGAVCVVVNGRRVERLEYDGQDLVGPVIEAALAGR